MTCRVGLIIRLSPAPVFQAHAASPDHLEFAPVTVPRYEDYKYIGQYAPTVVSYREASDDSRFVMQRAAGNP
jgi:hypothetical protein